MATALTRYKIGEADKKWIETFRKRPFGHHPPELMRLLNRMRAEDIEGKYVLVNLKPHKEWMVAEMQGRGMAPKYHNIRVDNLKDGEWEIFKLRWYRHTGEQLED
jgi:hypothetical protein